MATESNAPVRLQKVLAAAGIASRRACEELIRAGRVAVNGQVVRELGVRVVPGIDGLTVDGRPVGSEEQKTYILLNKPQGYLCTAADSHGRPTVLDLVPQSAEQRIYPVGRLDMDSEGLLLLTNDGALANALLHPRYHIPKRYRVWVDGRVDPSAIQRLASGVPLDDGPTLPAQVALIGTEGRNTVLSFTIYEGRKRQIRRMCAAVGHEVRKLVREEFGPLSLGVLPQGKSRHLRSAEVEALFRAAGEKRRDME